MPGWDQRFPPLRPCAPTRAPPAANDEWTALVVEPEPVHALDLRRSLHGLGCAVLGPVGSTVEAMDLLRQRRPDLALLDAGWPDDGGGPPLVEALAAGGVPFAVLAAGEPGPLATHPLLRAAPRLAKPCPPAELRRSVDAMRRAGLERRLAAAERRIAENRERLGRQARLLRRFVAAGHDAETARGLLREMARGLRLMRMHRSYLRRQLAAEADEPR